MQPQTKAEKTPKLDSRAGEPIYYEGERQPLQATFREAVLFDGVVRSSISRLQDKATFEMKGPGLVIKHGRKTVLVPYSNIKSIELEG